MNLKALLVTLAGAAWLAGCSTPPTPYQPASSREKAGYSEIRIERNRYRVTVTGRSAADSETTEAHARRRAAELTLASGYLSFQIVRKETFRSETRRAASFAPLPPPFPFDPFPSIRRTELQQPSGPSQTVIEFVMSNSSASGSPDIIDAARALEETVRP